MSKAAIDQAFEVVTVRQVASAVNCDRRTVRTVRDKGRVARTVIGRTIAQALAAMSGVPVKMIMAPDGDGPVDDVAEPETPIAKERENAVAAGDLLDLETVSARSSVKPAWCSRGGRPRLGGCVLRQMPRASCGRTRSGDERNDHRGAWGVGSELMH